MVPVDLGTYKSLLFSRYFLYMEISVALVLTLGWRNTRQITIWCCCCFNQWCRILAGLNVATSQCVLLPFDKLFSSCSVSIFWLLFLVLSLTFGYTHLRLHMLVYFTAYNRKVKVSISKRHLFEHCVYINSNAKNNLKNISKILK